MKVLCVGDIVARPGREALSALLRPLRQEFQIDFVIVNGENSAGGSGIDKKCHQAILDAGADVITLGDHTWRRSEVKAILSEAKANCLCPGNYPASAPARGWGVFEVLGAKIGVLNVLGRTFLQASLDCPFQYAEKVLSSHLAECQIRIVDFHGEATSEKLAFARRFEGRISLVFGTHTHVQTADEQILPAGTAYITDVGMTGSHAGVIGMDKQTAIDRFLTGMPSAYKEAAGELRLNGVLVEFDDQSFTPVAIERISRAVG